MIGVTVGIDTKALSKRLAEMRQNEFVSEVFKRYARHMVAHYKEATPVSEEQGGGSLARSWDYRIALRRNKGQRTAALQIVNKDPRALKLIQYLMKGTKPHKIAPKKAKALAFAGPSGDPIWARFVNHPGTRPVRAMGAPLRRKVSVYVNLIRKGIAEEMVRRKAT